MADQVGQQCEIPVSGYNSYMTQTHIYSLAIEPQKGGYLAYFPALPGCHTWGKTFEEAVKNAEDAHAVYVETLAAHGDAVPHQAAIMIL